MLALEITLDRRPQNNSCKVMAIKRFFFLTGNTSKPVFPAVHGGRWFTLNGPRLRQKEKTLREQTRHFDRESRAPGILPHAQLSRGFTKKIILNRGRFALESPPRLHQPYSSPVSFALLPESMRVHGKECFDTSTLSPNFNIWRRPIEKVSQFKLKFLYIEDVVKD